MSVTYRAVKRSEEAEAMELWGKVFGVPAPFFQSLMDVQSDRRLSQTRVAVDDGRIVSALHVFYRMVRGEGGRIYKLGGIGSVATADDARKQGHSGRLITDVIDLMERDGCDWSQLFTGVNGHYARYGWVTVQTPYRNGTVRKTAVASETFHIEEVTEALMEKLPTLARIYDAYCANRPLTTIRTARTWRTATIYRMCSEANARVFIANDVRNAARGYLVYRGDTVIEAACIPGYEPALISLSEHLRKDLVAKGVDSVSAHTPRDAPSNAAFDALAVDVIHGEHGAAMIRPIAGRTTIEEIRGLINTPSAVCWPLDGF